MNEQELHSGAAQAALQRAAEHDRRKRYEEAQQRMMDREGETITRISINSPHRVQTSGGEAAFTIVNRPATPTEETSAAAALTKSFALSDATSGETVTLRVKAGFLDSTSFDEATAAISADGVVYLKVTFSVTDATWSVTNRERIIAAGDVPENDGTHAYFPLGAYHLDGDGNLVIDTGDAGKGDQTFELNHCPNFYTFPLTYSDTPTWNPG